MNIENYKPNSKLTKEILKENNFRYIEGVYSYRFPVYKYKKETTLWCTLYIDIENDSCNLNIFDQNNNTYAPFFNRTYGGENKVVESIDRKISVWERLNPIIKEKVNREILIINWGINDFLIAFFNPKK